MKRRVQRHDVIQPLDPSYKLIPLTQGQNALVDTADFEWLSQWNWSAWKSPQNGAFYAQRWSGHGERLMHRLILDAPRGVVVDHKDHDTLDNRRKNLRKCTNFQSMQNRGIHKRNTSGFKGVSFQSKARGTKRWICIIGSEGKQKFVGLFYNPEDAARAYDEKAKELYGEFAHLNFPPSTEGEPV